MRDQFTAEHLIKWAAPRIERLFNKLGAIHPLYHYITDGGEHGVFTPPEFCITKDMMVAFARTVFTVERVVTYVFVNEVWTMETDVTHEEVNALIEQHGGSIEHMPGRKEAVMLMGEDAQGVVHGQMDIHRPEGCKPYLGKLKVDRPRGVGGRMVGLLPVHGTRQ